MFIPEDGYKASLSTPDDWYNASLIAAEDSPVDCTRFLKAVALWTEAIAAACAAREALESRRIDAGGGGGGGGGSG